MSRSELIREERGQRRGDQPVYTPRPQAYPDFLSRQAPLNYIAGLGRGAAGILFLLFMMEGFTTRSDIGPARGLVEENDGKDKPVGAALDPERFQDPDNEAIFLLELPYGADDEEADRIYQAIDDRMEERSKARREVREREDREKNKSGAPKIQEQFADLKRGLSAVTEDEWANIPDVGDLTRKKGKKNKNEFFTPVTDSLLQSSKDALAYSTTESEGQATDYRQFGAAKDKILSLRLDQASDSASGQTNIDPKGYLTEMGSINLKSDAEISDIRKARTLLKSVTSTNPTHAPGKLISLLLIAGWIAAARLEEVAGKTLASRTIIAQGCATCPRNEDVWLESSRLNTPANAKVILAQAITHNPHSVKIWLAAVNLEQSPLLQRKVLRRALEFIPNSVTIWRALITLEDDPEDAKILLSRAVECVPLSVDLWLALARLETYANAKTILNKARLAIPTAHEIWMQACKLEESNGGTAKIQQLVDRAVQVLEQKGAGLDREAWITEARKCEDEGSVLTCQAVINATIAMNVENMDLKKTLLDDAEEAEKTGHTACARGIFAYAIKSFPVKKGVYRRAAEFEQRQVNHDAQVALLTLGVGACPQAEVLWLMLAKTHYLAKDLLSARAALEGAFLEMPSSEGVWLAAIKIEVESGERERGRVLAQAARSKSGTQRVWMRAVCLERMAGEFQNALKMVDESLTLFDRFDKLWMIKGQLECHLGDNTKARETYAKGVKLCPKSIGLWILASRLEEFLGHTVKARALLEKARQLNTKNDTLWLESVRVESRSENTLMAASLLARALQECPASGLLWSECILTETKPLRKARSADALKRAEKDPHVLLAVARLFWSERKLDKARAWFLRVVRVEPGFGDGWAWLLRFEVESSSTDNAAESQENVDKIVKECVSADPKNGSIWIATRKDWANAGKLTADILKLSAAKLSNDL